jgi:DNA-directed RNA polymerase specialized sigma24 family protein
MEALASRLVKPQERTVLKMRLENGLSAEEIARVLGKSVSWVKVQLRSIRRAWNAMNRDG